MNKQETVILNEYRKNNIYCIENVVSILSKFIKYALSNFFLTAFNSASNVPNDFQSLLIIIHTSLSLRILILLNK